MVVDCKSCDEEGFSENIITRRGKDYKKPEIKKEEKMNFPLEIINAKGEKVVCRQCSSCHGCR